MFLNLIFPIFALKNVLFLIFQYEEIIARWLEVIVVCGTLIFYMYQFHKSNIAKIRTEIIYDANLKKVFLKIKNVGKATAFDICLESVNAIDNLKEITNQYEHCKKSKIEDVFDSLKNSNFSLEPQEEKEISICNWEEMCYLNKKFSIKTKYKYKTILLNKTREIGESKNFDVFTLIILKESNKRETALLYKMEKELKNLTTILDKNNKIDIIIESKTRKFINELKEKSVIDSTTEFIIYLTPFGLSFEKESDIKTMQRQDLFFATGMLFKLLQYNIIEYEEDLFPLLEECYFDLEDILPGADVSIDLQKPIKIRLLES